MISNGERDGGPYKLELSKDTVVVDDCSLEELKFGFYSVANHQE